MSDNVTISKQNQSTECEETLFKNNPFCILKISPQSSQWEIISQTEEMSLLSDAEICMNAQNSLLNPKTRIAAELSWFIGTSDENLTMIISCINNREVITTDDLSCIAKLNASLFNFELIDINDIYAIKDDILSLNIQYEKISHITVLSLINHTRKEAGLTLALESDVVQELVNIRANIRQIITKKLQALPEYDYVELVTLIAEDWVADFAYNNGVIIEDIIDQFEISWKTTIESKAEDIINQCQSIAINIPSNLWENVDNLIKTTKNWDVLAQPLQLRCKIMGCEHEESRVLAVNIKALAFFLNYEKDQTNIAIKLMLALKAVFAELPELLEWIEADYDTLSRIKKEKEEYELEQIRSNRMDKFYEVNIKSHSYITPSFCTCCMKPTNGTEHISYSVTTSNKKSETTHTLEADMPICSNCEKHRVSFSIMLLGIYSLSAITTILAMLLLMYVGGIGGLISFTSGSILGLISFILLTNILKVKELSIEHSTRGKSVRLFSQLLPDIQLIGTTVPGGFSKTITFTFSNREYAELFKEANKDIASDLQEIIHKNSAKSGRIFSVMELPFMHLLFLLVIYAIISFLIVCFQ